jgi:hypothetical protein
MKQIQLTGNEAKLIEYAYPTSTTATKQGYGETGCWFVSLYKSITACDRVAILQYFPTKLQAEAFAEKCDYPYNFMHKYNQ